MNEQQDDKNKTIPPSESGWRVVRATSAMNKRAAKLVVYPRRKYR